MDLLTPRPEEGQGAAGHVLLTGWQPGDARVAAEPRLLPAGETARGAHRFLPRLVQRALPVEVAQHLLVAERAARRLAVAQSLAIAQFAYLGLEAGRPHAVHPG